MPTDLQNHFKPMQGYLLKWTNYVHGWQSRYFCLKNGILMYHKSEIETSYGCRGAIAVKTSTLTLHGSDCCLFDVAVHDYVWYLRANTKRERDMWIKAIQEHARAFFETQNNSKIEVSTDDQSNSAPITTTANNSVRLSAEYPIGRQRSPDNHQRSDRQTDSPNHSQQHNLIQIEQHSSQTQYQPQQQQEVARQTPTNWCQQQRPQFHQNHSQHFSIVDNFSDAQEDFQDPQSDATVMPTNSQGPVAAQDSVILVAEARDQNSATKRNENDKISTDNPLWSKIDSITKDQLYQAQMGIVEGDSTNGWQLFAEDGPMRLYTRELVIEGLVCDPLKAVHVVKGITGYEMCQRFFSPSTRFDWEHTLETMNVLEEIDKSTLIFHQVHKKVWLSAQRDAVFWSHIRKIDEAKSSCLSSDDSTNTTRNPNLKLQSVWVVCNNSVDRPDVPPNNCVRVRLTVILVCETYIPKDCNEHDVKREDLVCKIIYSSTINPGGWVPVSMLRAFYKREYPKFLDSFSKYVISSTEFQPVVFQ